MLQKTSALIIKALITLIDNTKDPRHLASDDDDDDDDDDDELLLQYGRPMKGVKHYFQGGPLSIFDTPRAKFKVSAMNVQQ